MAKNDIFFTAKGYSWHDWVKSGWYLAEWLERLTAIAVVTTVLGSIPASSDTVESEGWQMKQCWKSYIKSVSPAYGNVSLALVKYSNEGGPGPRYNMKEVPGSTLIMLVVHAYPVPLFSEAGGKETRGWISPFIRATWARPPPAPFKYILHPLQRCR